MEPLFADSSYDTPADEPRLLLDRIALGSRWGFAAGIFNIVNQARRIADKGCFDDEAWIKASYAIMKCIEGCGGKFHLQGLDNIGTGPEPVIFISNHMSTLETFVFPCLIASLRRVTFVVKDSLVTHPLFGSIMRSRDPIVVSRDNPKEDFKLVMGQGQELLAQGISIVIFPQSTRTTTFAPEQFNTLGIKLARANGVKVVPVAIKTDFWGNGKYIKDMGPINRKSHIHMVFGPPLTVQGSGKEEHQQIIGFITAHLDEWNL